MFFLYQVVSFVCACERKRERGRLKVIERMRLNTPGNEHTDSRKCRHTSSSFKQKGRTLGLRFKDKNRDTNSRREKRIFHVVLFHLHTVPYACTALDLALFSLMGHAWLLHARDDSEPLLPLPASLFSRIHLPRQAWIALVKYLLCVWGDNVKSLLHTLDWHDRCCDFIHYIACFWFTDSETAILTCHPVTLGMLVYKCVHIYIYIYIYVFVCVCVCVCVCVVHATVWCMLAYLNMYLCVYV